MPPKNLSNLQPPGRDFVGVMPDGRLGFLSNGQIMYRVDNERLVRIAAKLWCQGAADGQYATMASINDVSGGSPSWV